MFDSKISHLKTCYRATLKLNIVEKKIFDSCFEKHGFENQTDMIKLGIFILYSLNKSFLIFLRNYAIESLKYEQLIDKVRIGALNFQGDKDEE